MDNPYEAQKNVALRKFVIKIASQSIKRENLIKMATQSNDNSSTPQYRLIDGRYKIVPQFLQPTDSKVGEIIDAMTKCQRLSYLFPNRNNLAEQFVDLITKFVHGNFEDPKDFAHGHLIFRHNNC